MDWREQFLKTVGPGVLGGMSFGQWLHLLWQERFAVSPSRLPRAVSITVQSLQNSVFRALENLRYGARLRDVQVEPPIFVLGHWRTGTTHLHQLLVQDARFAFPNGYQTAFPHTFLTTERFNARLLNFFLPKRRPMDNMEWSLASPQEDELALCSACGESPCLGWAFPRQRKKYDRYLTFRDASAGETARWCGALELFLKKLTLKHGRRLVLKSPPHTCRIRLLLEMFPGAKFVHIHRNPYVVFQSTRKLFLKMFAWVGLQRPELEGLDDWILEQYREMYDVFFEERPLIPSGSYHEVAFEDLERDPMGEVRQVYQALGLPEFGIVEADLQRYVDSLRGYRKNEFPPLPAPLTERIRERWGRTIEEWGYGANERG